MPPDAVSVCEYDVPTAPLGSVGAVTMVKPAEITTVNALVAVTEALSVTCTVKLNGPVLPGVPVITPVAAFKIKPEGKAPVMVTHV